MSQVNVNRCTHHRVTFQLLDIAETDTLYIGSGFEG